MPLPSFHWPAMRMHPYYMMDNTHTLCRFMLLSLLWGAPGLFAHAHVVVAPLQRCGHAHNKTTADGKCTPVTTRLFRKETQAVQASTAPVVTKSFRFIPVAELQILVSDRADTSFSQAELKDAAQRMTRYYGEQGRETQIELPRQDLRNGSIHIIVSKATSKR